MAEITIKSVDKRTVVVDVVWDDGLFKTDIEIHDVPVEDFNAAKEYLFSSITGHYDEVFAAAERQKYLNPVVDPYVLAAVGHTFNNNGDIIR